MQYMASRCLVRAKEVRDDGSIVEIVVWELEEPLTPCQHPFKYRLFFGIPGATRVRYDNERGKGDHRHFGTLEVPYDFESVTLLLDDFQRDVENWEGEQ